MDRESFFARKAVTTDVTLDDGTSIRVRKLKQSEVETMQRKYKGEDKALEGLRYIVARAAIDDSGKRMFEDDDTAKLAEIEFDDVSKIANAVMKFSGLTVDAKNV